MMMSLVAQAIDENAGYCCPPGMLAFHDPEVKISSSTYFHTRQAYSFIPPFPMTDMRDADEHITEKIWRHLFPMLHPARRGAKQL